MRIIANIFSLITLTAILSTSTMPLFSAENDLSYLSENNYIKFILDNEKNEKDQNNIIDILNYIDEVYADLYNKLKNGGKIKIFFDPAHGRLDSGKWEGEVTGRLSAAGLTEEYYSIQFARRLYKLLANNKYLKIATTNDYKDVLTGRTTEYRRLRFKDACALACSEKAFIMISEHLNNISSIYKTDGITNLSGIHITCDDAGNRYVTHVPSSYEGYLSLYNKYDSTGLSKDIAHKIKESLAFKNVKLNSWEHGAVADDRFSYFIDFPVSLIFEQGFISNPEEEKKMRDPEYQQKIIDTQYSAILESIKDVFGVDISEFWLKKENENTGLIDLLKLSRISIYYLKNDNPEKTVTIIDEIEKNYNDSAYNIKPYINLKNRIEKAEKSFKKCKYLRKENRFKEAKKNLINAARAVCNEPIFSALADKYSNYALKYFGLEDIACTKEKKPSKITVPSNTVKASLKTPVILSIEKDQALEDAVDKALSPGLKDAPLLIKSFNDASIREKIIAEQYSEKAKKYITVRKWVKKKVNFKEGLYIIVLDKNLKITKIQRVSSVILDPEKYQNHQYLKNSYFASTSKEKAI